MKQNNWQSPRGGVCSGSHYKNTVSHARTVREAENDAAHPTSWQSGSKEWWMWILSLLTIFFIPGAQEQGVVLPAFWVDLLTFTKIPRKWPNLDGPSPVSPGVLLYPCKLTVPSSYFSHCFPFEWKKTIQIKVHFGVGENLSLLEGRKIFIIIRLRDSVAKITILCSVYVIITYKSVKFGILFRKKWCLLI